MSRPSDAPLSHREVVKALWGLMMVLFVALVSSTIVTTALPRIMSELDGDQTQFTWMITANLLAATASTPIWGRLADLFSKKLVIQVAIGVFIVGSLLCGFAQDAGQLIAARACQGLGVGGLQALVQVVMAALIPPRNRGRYNGYLGSTVAIASVCGPLLGGVIVDTPWLGWRWCFFIGVPVALIAFALLQRTLHLATIRQGKVSIDYLGATLIAAGVSILLVWISFVDKWFAWLSWQTLTLVGAGLVVLAFATWAEKRAAQPVVPLDIIVQRTPALAIVASVAVGMAMFGGAVYLGQYFQIGRGFGPTEAGLLTTPLMFGILVSSTASGRLITRTGRIRPFPIGGCCVLVLGYLALGFVDRSTNLAYIGVAIFLVGAGLGMTSQNLVLTVQNTVAVKDLGAASGSVTFFRSLGGTIGVTVLGAILARRVDAAAGADPAAAEYLRSSGSLNLDTLPEALGQSVRDAYGSATGFIFLVSAAIGLVGLVAVLLLKPATLRTTIDVHAPARAATAGPEPLRRAAR